MAATGPDPNSVILPGQILGSTRTHAPGPGTHVNGDKILSSITGLLTTASPSTMEHSKQTPKKQHLNIGTSKNPRPILSVSALSTPSHPAPILPVVGDHVYGRVTVVTRMQANLSIVAVSQSESGEQLQSLPADADDDDVIRALASTATPKSYRPLATPLRGILRSQDVRMTEKDRVKMISSVSVGDIVRAAVVGIGDQGGYFLSTAGNELGVVMAWSARGNGCVPLSWCEVGDVITGEREGRKVAKPI